MKQGCTTCGTREEFRLTSVGWVCPGCGAGYPFYWALSKRISWISRLLISTCGEKKIYEKVMLLIRSRNETELEDLCLNCATQMPPHIEVFIYRALGWVVWLPRLISQDIREGLPLTKTMNHLEEIYNSFRVYFGICRPSRYPYLARLTERTCAFTSLLLQAAELDLLRKFPELREECARNRARMEELHAETIPPRTLRPPRFTVYEHTALENMNDLVSRCRGQVLDFRRVLREELFRQAEELVRREGEAAWETILTALYVGIPDWERSNTEWIHRGSPERLEARKQDLLQCLDFMIRVSRVCPDLDLLPLKGQFVDLIRQVLWEQEDASMGDRKRPRLFSRGRSVVEATTRLREEQEQEEELEEAPVRLEKSERKTILFPLSLELEDSVEE